MVKNIIFDLGGVILNLNTQLTYDAFIKLGLNLNEIPNSTEFLNNYEIGKITDDEFRDEIKRILGKQISNGQIDEAWNSMLLDLPESRFRILKELRLKYNLYLLSNTNNIHISAFYCYLNSTYPKIYFEDFFSKIYYSHIMGSRKPNANCFLHVINENKLNVSETIFIDDNVDNIAGANALGLKTILALNPIDDSIYKLIDEQA